MSGPPAGDAGSATNPGDGPSVPATGSRPPHPYRIPAIVMGSIALFFAGLFLVGILLPSGWTAERTARVAAPPERVFPYFARAAAWSEWTPGPDSGVELFGPVEGAGSGRRWDDEFYGEGEFRIATVSPPRELAYDVAVEGGAIRIRGTVRLDPDGDGTSILWREEGDFGWNPLLGYLTGRMSELQGEQMSASLERLRTLVEGSPVPGGGGPDGASIPGGGPPGEAAVSPALD